MTWTDHTAEPMLPPLLSGRRIIPGQSVRDAAVAGARAGSLGACDVLWDGDPTRVDIAIVLEPDVDLRQAAQMLPLAMVAVGDCIGAMAPPQVGVVFRWPNTIAVNGGRVGQIQVIADDVMPDAVPRWLVASLELQMRRNSDAAEPGQTPDTTSLADEGCEELTNLDIMGAFARHFMAWLHIWQDEGFGPLRQAWLERADGKDEPEKLTPEQVDAVTVVGMDEDGNLLVHGSSTVPTELPLLDAISVQPSQEE